MTLAELHWRLTTAGVRLSLTPRGRVRYDASAPLPRELGEAMQAHRDELLLELTRGRAADGRFNVMWLATRPGRCSTCAFWRGPDSYGEGQCPLGRAAHGWLDGVPLAPVTTTLHHSCGAREGRGWRRKA